HGIVLARRGHLTAIHEERDQTGDGLAQPPPGRRDCDQLGTEPGHEAHGRRLLYRSEGRMTMKRARSPSVAEHRDERRREDTLIKEGRGGGTAGAPTAH